LIQFAKQNDYGGSKSNLTSWYKLKRHNQLPFHSHISNVAEYRAGVA